MASKALAKRNVQVGNPSNTGMPSAGIIIGLILIGLFIYLVMKNRQSNGQQPAGQYLNEEKWDIQYNADGLPTSVTIHRDARRS